MASVIGVNLGAARPVQEGDHIYDFSPDFQVMCHNCRKAAKLADELFKITTDEMIFNNITRWRRLVVGTLTIGRFYQYYKEEPLVEVIRRVAVQAHGQEDTLYIDFIYNYKRIPHESCTLERKVIVATNAPNGASFSVGYVEDTVTELVLDQAGIDPRLKGIFAITHDELFEGEQYKQLLSIYIGRQPINPCERPWSRVQIRGGLGTVN
jgi:hypothetical protein